MTNLFRLLINFYAIEDLIVLLMLLMYKVKIFIVECWKKNVPLVAEQSKLSCAAIIISRRVRSRREAIVYQFLMATTLMKNDRPISRCKSVTNILIASCYDDSALFHRLFRSSGSLRYLDRSFPDVSRAAYTCWFGTSIPAFFFRIGRRRQVSTLIQMFHRFHE